MTTTAWHCDADLLRRYTSGATDLALSASVEAHLVGCGGCQALLADTADPLALNGVWTAVRDTIQRPVLPPVLRLLRRLGLDERDAVLLSASQSLSGPWTLATTVVLAFVVLASFPGHPIGQALYLLVAPLIPVLGVVAAFASGDDNAELSAATPYSKTRLALLRTAAVIVTTVPLVVAMGAIVPGTRWLSVVWLGPALGLTLTALVALTWWPPPVIGAVLSGGWLLVVSDAYGHHHVGSAVDATAQLCYLALAVLATVLLAARIRLARTPGGYE